MFKCEQCGCCCRNLHKSKVYEFLDRGDGACKYLIGNRCSIYQNRPLLCQVDKSYDKFFSMLMSREEFYRENKKICEKLRKEEE